jgi:cadmium resistance protein CadD (predicted permease)
MDIERMALLIPILGIVLGIAVAIVAIVANHREKLKRSEQRHRERITAIEKGIELPLDPEPEPEVRRGSGLKSGLMGIFVGVVLYFALKSVADDDIALFGLIPAAVGLASLISYFVESRKNGTGSARKPDA